MSPERPSKTVYVDVPKDIRSEREARDLKIMYNATEDRWVMYKTNTQTAFPISDYKKVYDEVSPELRMYVTSGIEDSGDLKQYGLKYEPAYKSWYLVKGQANADEVLEKYPPRFPVGHRLRPF